MTNALEKERPTAATFGVRWPVGVSVGVAVLLVLGVAATSEVAPRTSFARRWLPIPSVGAGQPQLDKKLVLLAESVTNGGPVECLFVGSSQVHRGIDPVVVDDPFRTGTGRGLRSFNFGLGGVSETGEGPIARIQGGQCVTDINELEEILGMSTVTQATKPEYQRLVRVQKVGR